MASGVASAPESAGAGLAIAAKGGIELKKGGNLVEELLNTLEVLKKIAANRSNKIYKDNEVLEEEENILEMKELYSRLSKVLKSLNETLEICNDDMMAQQLIELHLVYSDFVWQYDQMHEMIKKMIKLYR